MPSGIFGATITTLTNGTVANAPDVMASLSSLKNNGVNNDGGVITTDGNGNITALAGQLRNVTMLATPFQMFSNPTLNSGVTRTDTYTGGSTGVPSGAIAVIMGIGIVANTTTGYVQIAPHGGTLGNYVNFADPVAGQYMAGFAIIPLSAAGQADVKANGANIVLQGWYIYGYII